MPDGAIDMETSKSFHPTFNFSFQIKQKTKKTECASFDHDHISLDSVRTQLCNDPENGLTAILPVFYFLFSLLATK